MIELLMFDQNGFIFIYLTIVNRFTGVSIHAVYSTGAKV